MRYDIIYLCGISAYLGFYLLPKIFDWMNNDIDDVDIPEHLRKSIIWPIFFVKFMLVQLKKMGVTIINAIVKE